MRTALLCIGTGRRYQDFAEQMIQSARQFFPTHDSIVWTDTEFKSSADHLFLTRITGYPASTLYRYKIFLTQRELLSTYDQLFYCDADMRWVAPAGDIFSDGITATLHPGFYVNNRPGTPERRRESTAFLRDNSFYYCGGFNGGCADAFLQMADAIDTHIAKDDANGIMAVWHDESHLNRYLFHNPPLKVLSPAYCYPEGYDGNYGWAKETFEPILIALDKKGRR